MTDAPQAPPKKRALALVRAFQANMQHKSLSEMDWMSYMDLCDLINQYERGNIEAHTLAAKCDELEGR